MKSPLDNAFGQSLSAWVARVTQQIKEIETRLEQYRAVAIEMNDELRDIGNKLSLATMQLTNLEARIKSIEENQSKVVWGILGAIGAAVIAVVLGWQKVEYQLQHPPQPKSELPAKTSPKL